MFQFNCPKCGESLGAEMSAIGKQSRCAGCQEMVVVPPPDLLPRVGCPHCRAELDFPTSAAGNIEKCPKCGGAVQVPNAEGTGGTGCLSLLTSSLTALLLAAGLVFGLGR